MRCGWSPTQPRDTGPRLCLRDQSQQLALSCAREFIRSLCLFARCCGWFRCGTQPRSIFQTRSNAACSYFFSRLLVVNVADLFHLPLSGLDAL